MGKYKEFGLSEYDAAQLCAEKEVNDYFETLIQHTSHYKAAANWINGPVKQYVNDAKFRLPDCSYCHPSWRRLLQLVEDGKVNFSVASHRILPVLINNSELTPIDRWLPS